MLLVVRGWDGRGHLVLLLRWRIVRGDWRSRSLSSLSVCPSHMSVGRRATGRAPLHPRWDVRPHRYTAAHPVVGFTIRWRGPGLAVRMLMLVSRHAKHRLTHRRSLLLLLRRDGRPCFRRWRLRPLFHDLPLGGPPHLAHQHTSDFLEPLALFGVHLLSDAAFDGLVFHLVWGDWWLS